MSDGMTLNRAVILAVEDERTRRRWDQKELARRAGVQESTLSRWIAGRTTLKTDNLDVLAHALGMSTVDLVERAVALQRDAVDIEDIARQTLPAEVLDEIETFEREASPSEPTARDAG